MYTLRYLENDVSYEEVSKLLDKLSELANAASEGGQFVVVEKEGNGFIEFALGLGEESLLLYTPESEDHDLKISCNKLVSMAKSEPLMIKSLEGEVSEFTMANTVQLDLALLTIEKYLAGEEFIDIVDWYIY